MLKIAFLSAFFVGNFIFISAQQEPYFTHFAFNKVIFNPAYAGSSGGICINTINHKQWLQLPDQTGLFRTESGLAVAPNVPVGIGPKTNAFSISAPFAFDGNRDLGGFYFATISDIIAYENNTMYKFGFAGAIRIGKEGVLRLGADFTNQTKRWNTAALRAMQLGDPLLPIGGNPSSSKWMIGSGLVLSLPQFYNLKAGISLTSINQVEFDYLTLSGSVYIQSARHLYATAGWRITQLFRNPNFTLEPNVMIRTVHNEHGWVKPQTEIQGLITYQSKLSTGAGIRAQYLGADAVYIMLGFYPIEALKLKKMPNHAIRIGMSYDFTVQTLRLSSRNTQELQVNYCYHFLNKPIVIDHPREISNHRYVRFRKFWFSD